jgi:2'-5' RNA ligase
MDGQNANVRLFVAIGLPGQIVELLETLPRPEAPRLRWTTPEQWHVTLQFFGEVDWTDEVIDAVRDAVAELPGGVVEAVLGPATRWFPGRTVLHAPVTGLETLAARVRERTAPWAADRGQAFSGHITLARTRGGEPGPAELAGTPVTGRFTVTDVAVFASSLLPGGAVYDVLERISIGQTGV